MTTQPNATYWWNLPIEELEQMADDKGNIKLSKSPTMIKATNPYSNESAMLTQEEHKLYIEIKQAEFDEDYNTMQKKLSKFSRLNASAYMVLLD
jgi:hypothetical protein